MKKWLQKFFLNFVFFWKKKRTSTIKQLLNLNREKFDIYEKSLREKHPDFYLYFSEDTNKSIMNGCQYNDLNQHNDRSEKYMKMHAFSYIFGRFMLQRSMKFSIRCMEKPRKNIVFCMHMHTNTYIFREPKSTQWFK